MLWLCLNFPRLPIEVFLRAGTPPEPLVVAGSGNAPLVVACDERAAAARVLGLLGEQDQRLTRLLRDSAETGRWLRSSRNSTDMARPERVADVAADALANRERLARALEVGELVP